MQKAIKQLSKQIKVSFQDIEFNLEKIRSITKVITETTVDMLPDRKDIYKSISGMINKGELKKIIQQVIEHGPLQENVMKNKIQAMEGD